jgi:hypothetical protein
MIESKILERNSSSISSLNDSSTVINLQNKALNKSITSNANLSNSIFFKEEVINFSQNNNETTSMQCFMATNVNYEKCDQYAFMIGLSGDLFFFKYEIPIKKPIWHKQLNSIVLKYFKIDIDVSF